jgi:glyoxylase-like metal-dependent hydrolase (beta-lactamase superfamily II)
MKPATLLALITLALTMVLSTTVAFAAPRKGAAQKRPAAPAVKIQTHTASTDSFLVNSYLLETANRVILIGTQLTISDARTVQERLTKIGKPLAAILITNAAPEHYNNIATFRATYPDVPVYSTAAIVKAISDNDARYRAKWARYYYENYPTALALPTNIVAAGESLTIDTLTLKIDEVGTGTAPPTMLIALPAQKALFVGDLVYNNLFANLRDGHSKAWLNNLATVRKNYPSVTTIYPGHGASGTRALLATQSDYLTKFRTLISLHLNPTHPREPFTMEARSTVRRAMVTDYPKYKCHLLLDISFEPVTAELLAEIGYQPKPADDEEDEE